MRAIKGDIWAPAAEKRNGLENIVNKKPLQNRAHLAVHFVEEARMKRRCQEFPLAEKDLAFCANRFT
jgi:hypothetical protein